MKIPDELARPDWVFLQAAVGARAEVAGGLALGNTDFDLDGLNEGLLDVMGEVSVRETDGEGTPSPIAPVEPLLNGTDLQAPGRGHDMAFAPQNETEPFGGLGQ